MKELIADVSLWNDVNYLPMQAGGFKGVIIRAGGSLSTDPKLRIHTEMVKDVGLPYAYYYWIDPLCSGLEQAQHAKSLMDDTCSFMAGDVEQWWADWTAYRRFVAKKIPAKQVGFLPSAQVAGETKAFFDKLDQEQVESVVYTRYTFAQSYLYSIKGWFNTRKLWIAQYPRIWPKKTVRYEDIASYFPTFDAPYTPLGYDGASIWQWTGDCLSFPGSGGPLDVNWCLGDSFGLFKTYTPAKKSFDVYTLNPGVGALNVRKGPTATSDKLYPILLPKRHIYVVPSDEPWLKLRFRDGYFNKSYTTRVC